MRFLPREGYTFPPDPRLYVFGTGKRIFPERYLADTLFFITAAMILSVFDIEKKVGKDGKVIEPVVNPITGATTHMTPYECAIKPRYRLLSAGDVDIGKNNTG
ncbi:hypothetical protein E1B28_003708 [Marasmius oreades]|uniref:Uncharacterized protein n=1 Tax=Marasmius oreades TaxID=181124 RepID=A0A9P7UX69_9AGAR|nr:uncharacterized protein E1B28_003708 [Marasmius oreades]KAG7096260.1 hypothetical protein E1B28_003708 [Marasmius oreades]